ncbi:hypothetical protein F7725_007714 [Dissostichus mawsoni]|uniref:Ig-like domain-containing protein n=1 Tax=Dissostichus mawsoni TaxID=36200 RepID=A0A7J5Y685_DISMA|nr:hypothetical protein F7725_007714 [Dissostichus mawsoni]
MADSEEFRLKRLKHEERLSRVFDEVMGLGHFADSSRGSATSPRSEGQDETRGVDKTSAQVEQQPVEEEDSNGSRQEEKREEGAEESSLPCITSPSSVPAHRLQWEPKKSEEAEEVEGQRLMTHRMDSLRLGQEKKKKTGTLPCRWTAWEMLMW